MKRNLGVWAAIGLSLALTGCSGVTKEAFNQLEESYSQLDQQLSEETGKKDELQESYDAVSAELVEQKKLYEDTSKEYESLATEYGEYKTLTEDWAAFTEEEKAAALEVARREGEILGLDESKAALEGEVAGLEERINALQGEVVRISGEPIQFPAGVFYAGQDFEVGRYKIYDGSSNFFVENSSGRNEVNIILAKPGNRYDNPSEYIYKFSAGEQIEARSSFKMVPVE